jgi:hypothetical protein
MSQEKRRIAAGSIPAEKGSPRPPSDPFVKGLTAVVDALKQSSKANQALIDHLKS